MAVVEDGIVLAIGLLDLVQRLSNQETFDSVARHESQCAFEEVEPPEGRELIEHHQNTVTSFGIIQILRQAAADLVQHQPGQRLGA